MNIAPAPSVRDYSRILKLNLQLGDYLLFLYLLGFTRQYFWWLKANVVAWTLTICVAAVLWLLYLRIRPLVVERSGWNYWLIVGVPLGLAYMLRAAIPDRSFDVLSYHLLHSERSLSGTLFLPGDFFPTVTSFNPIADTITGFTRLAFGFRLGTIINLLALLWAGQIIDRILTPFIKQHWIRSISVLLVLLTEQALFEISTYMVDLLALPLLLQATFLTLNADVVKNRRANFVHIALLLGASLGFKFTNLAVVLPLLAIVTYRMLLGPQKSSPRQFLTTTLMMLFGFLAPVLPFTVYIYRLTGNPVFPLANTLFKSPFWPIHGGWDNRWGPEGIWQTLIWPILIWFKPERHSELALYSGRLSIGYVVGAVSLILLWRNVQIRTLCFVLLSSTIIWSATALGYSRYGLYQELLAGVTIVAVAASLMNLREGTIVSWRTALSIALVVLLTVQVCFACRLTLQKEWGGRPTVIDDPDGYKKNVTQMLRDRSLSKYLSSEARARFEQVDAWLETSPESTGFEVLLNPRAPIIAARQPEYFLTRDSRHEFIRKVEMWNDHRIYSLCFTSYLTTARQALAERGLEIVQETPIDLPYFSPVGRIGMMLLEVRVPLDPQSRIEFESSWLKGAFAASDYREEIIAANPPTVLHPLEKFELQLTVKNLGGTTWNAVGTRDFRYQINVGNRWIKNGAIAEDNRAVLGADLLPGHQTNVKLTVNAPATAGDYTLEVDMVHEGVTWFEERGGRPLLLPVRVHP